MKEVELFRREAAQTLAPLSAGEEKYISRPAGSLELFFAKTTTTDD